MFRNTAIGLIASVFCATGAQICDLNFNACPGTYSGKTVSVPMDVISLDPKFALCAEQVQLPGSVSPPSIVFVIDNSGSMATSDPQHARFTVVANLLDSIAQIAPTTEVGIVLFATGLSYDYTKNPYLVRAFPADPTLTDAYVPLTQLGLKFPNGSTGLDTLKHFLNETCTGGRNSRCSVPDTGISGGSSTDITLGFDAAKMAMASAHAVKANQYVIFLSDGKPSLDKNSPRLPMIADFMHGTNTPTTYTVFFDPNGGPAPDTIVMMTDSIRANGYSTTNPKSNYWAITLPANELHALLQDQVVNPILSNVKTTPATATLTVGGQTYNNVGVDAKDFIFPKRIPLAADQTTLQFTYSFTYTDTTGGVSTQKQKSVPYSVTIARTPNATIPDSLAKTCRDPASLTLVSGGQAITQVTNSNTNLEVRVKPSTGDACNKCTVAVKPSGTGDKETVAVSAVSNYYSGSFTRSLTTTVVAGNGNLEHIATDSIILVYVNPDNPLETVRASYPFVPSATVDWTLHNSYAQNDDPTINSLGKDWAIVAPANFVVTTADGKTDHFVILPGPLSRADSLRYVGFKVEVSGPFKVELFIYSNLGVLVNKMNFSVNAAEWAKLEQGSKPDTRIMRVLWNNRTMNGSLAATGAYIFKSTVTLDAQPGKAPAPPLANTRIVGVLRKR